MGWANEFDSKPCRGDCSSGGDFRMTVLEDLWYGNIDPHEAILTENNRYKHLLSDGQKSGRTQ